MPELARRLADTEAAVVMKLGRTFENVREALRQAGRLDEARYVERASSDAERVLPVADVDASTVPYMSMVVVPGRDLRADAAGRARGPPAHRAIPSVPQSSGPETASAGEVVVVGLGPGPDRWLTPEASAALAEVDHVVGYAPYVNRVPQREGLTRHASGNTVEVDRARARPRAGPQGRARRPSSPVATPASSAWRRPSSRPPRRTATPTCPYACCPGVTAAQAVAARAGAPLGGDFAIMSLSDRLKPWTVIEQAPARRSVGRPRRRPLQPRVAHAAPSRSPAPGRSSSRSATPRPSSSSAATSGVPRSRSTVTTLADLDPTTIDMKCLVIVCASGTRVTDAGQVWTPRYVH